MPAIFHLGRLLCWAVVLGYWAITALRAKQVTRSESRARQFLAYWLPLIIAVLLLGPGEGSPIAHPGDSVSIHVPGLGRLSHSLVVQRGAIA